MAWQSQFHGGTGEYRAPGASLLSPDAQRLRASRRLRCNAGASHSSCTVA
jgi:hypothetical protein